MKSKGINTNQEQAKIEELYIRAIELYPISIRVW